MPGPALTPIATPLPAASSKGPDATAPGREADAPEAGFAGELQRRIQGDAGKETDTAASPEDTQAEEQGAAQAAAPQPELAALLAGLVRPVEPRPAPAASLLDAPESVGLETRLGPAGLATDSAADRARSPLAVAADAGQAANLADTTADAAGKPASPPPLETAASLRESLTERGPDAAATPTNSFAAIHAAALANLRGEPTQAAQAPLPIHVATPADSPAWPEEVGHRVSWMVGQHESQAELTLTPPQLGKIEVSITISGDQTSAQFVTATRVR